MLRRRLLVLNKGQSLVEVVVALAIAILVVLALVSITTVSIKNAQFARNQEQAVKLSQEGMEWVRSQRDSLEWDTFKNKNDSNPWCFENLPAWDSISSQPTTLVSCSDCNKLTGMIFTRTALFTEISDESTRVKIEVCWEDSNGAHKSVQESIFTNWRSK